MGSDKEKKDVEIGDSLEELLGFEKKDAKKVERLKIQEGIGIETDRNKTTSKSKTSLDSQDGEKKYFKPKNDTNSPLELEYQGENSEKSDVLGANTIDLTQTNQNSNFKRAQKSKQKGTRTKRTLPSEYINEEGFFQCPPGVDIIPVTRKAFQDMIMVAQAVNEISKEQWGKNAEKLEVYMYLFAESDEIQEGQPARISSIYIPFHTAAETRVDVSERGVMEIKKYIQSTGKVLLGWSHSHGHFKVYSSHTDEINHQILLNETSNYLTVPPFKLKYMYGITVNDESDRFGVILSHYPCGHVERQVDEEFDIQGEPYKPREKVHRYKEIKDIVKERAKLIEPSQKRSKEETMDELTEQLLIEFLRNLHRTKDLLFNKMDETQEEHFAMIEKLLSKYDNLLMDGVEETFRGIADKILGAVKDFEKGI